MPLPDIPDRDRLARLRRTYTSGGLDEPALAASWTAQLLRWLDDAEAAGVLEINAMVLATASADGRPRARTVLLKGLDEHGLVFFTNYRSAKARDLEANPRASAVFPWVEVQRQVIVTGAVSRIDAADSDRYWASRPYGSQIGALASPQSEVVDSRSVLEDARDALLARHPEGGPVPRPEHWGGYVLAPDEVEFWQGRPDRLHDRLRYRRDPRRGWVTERLAP
jgi:pyridoxamine 5'-phosphate oxidase